MVPLIFHNILPAENIIIHNMLEILKNIEKTMLQIYDPARRWQKKIGSVS